MAHSLSAKKRIRQNAKCRARNLWRKRQIKHQTKAVLKAIQAQDVPTAESEFRKACGLLDRIATTSTLHRNTAARRKSRLSRRIRDLKQKAANN